MTTTAEHPRMRRRLIDRSFEIGPLALAGGASMTNSVVIVAAFGHLSSAAAFGTYQLALTAVGLIALIGISGSATAAMRAAARGEAAAFGLFRARLPYCVAGAGL